MTDSGSTPITLEGVCTFYSETGTEGGYWAFQDLRFTSENTNNFVCKKCGICWDKEREPDEPHYEESEEQLPPEEKQALEELLGHAVPPYCPAGSHIFELYPERFWLYEGLHVLEDGDQLTIYNPKNRENVVWESSIALQHYKLFTESAFGWWIHADQRGIGRNVWAKYFFEEYPAKLVPAPQKAEEGIE